MHAYRVLDESRREIRLLSLQCGQWQDKISCSLQIVSLDDKPKYKALSYVWGNAKLTHPILLHGIAFEVTVNLAAALRRLRQRFVDLAIWVDALCIDQGNTTEKEKQVELMQDIYESTEQVIVWLGEEDDGSHCTRFDSALTETSVITWTGKEDDEEIISSMSEAEQPQDKEKICRNDILKAFETLSLMARNRHFREIPLFDTTDLSNVTVSETHVKAYRVLVSLSQRPWWQRIWTVQEVILPPEAVVLYGSFVMPWSVFKDATHFWVEHRNNCCNWLEVRLDNELADTLSSMFWSVNQIEESRERFKTRFSPWHAYSRYRGRKATDPRDMVYALLSLVSTRKKKLENIPSSPPLLPPLIDINYSSSDHYELYRQWALLWIKVTKSLEVLIFAGEDERDPLLPSWVPDWTASVDVKTDGLYSLEINAMQALLRASSEFRAITEFRTPSTLLVDGLFIDTIHSFRKAESDGHSVEDGSPWIIEDYHPDWAGKSYPGGGDISDAIWRTCIRDMIYVPRGNIRRSIPGDYLEWSAWVNDPLSVDPKKNSAFRRGCQVDSRWKTFITRKGFLGCGPRSMRLGDEIFVLYGSRLPFVLRLVESQKEGGYAIGGQKMSQKEHKVVGFCYLHGIMDGEALEEPGYERSTIALR